MPRYALYFAPRQACPWQHFGTAWLGRSALHDQPVEQCRIDGLDPGVFRTLTATPRRYGFHATLKAPFRLAEDATLPDLIGALDRFCDEQCAIDLPEPEALRLGQFLALGWSSMDDRVAALAAECVTRFDDFRASLESEEILRRRRAGLSAREDQLLLRWGYPHVLDEFRLHLSLTGPLGGVPAVVVRRIHDAADEAIAALADTPIRLDAIGVYEEPTPGAPFRLVHRSAFNAGSGRLLYIVGPSGVGKDSLIDYARRQLSDAAPIRFARRTITRPARVGNERHIGITHAQFALLEAEQAFSMVWYANGHAYGIGREVSQWLAAGDTVVVNGSRAYAVTAAAAFAQMELVLVEARPDTIRRRLRVRARDDSAAIDARVARGGNEWETPACVVHRIDNDKGIDKAGEKLLALLLSPGARAVDDSC